MASRPPYDVAITRARAPIVMVDVRCAITDRASLGPGALTLAPDEYLLIESDPISSISLANAAWGESVIATDVSAMYVCYRLAGVDVIAVLAQGMPIDLESMAIGDCARTVLARTGVIVVRRDHGFELLIERSYARYAENWLAAASGRPVLETTL